MVFESKITITNNTKGKLPSLPFEDMKNAVLGKKFELSLVFVGDRVSRKLNNEYRSKDKPTNILSFPLSEDEGEIFLNYNLIKKQTKKFGRSFEDLVGFLFIHGLLHLKGFDHSDEMEKMEEKYCKKFGI